MGMHVLASAVDSIVEVITHRVIAVEIEALAPAALPPRFSRPKGIDATDRRFALFIQTKRVMRVAA